MQDFDVVAHLIDANGLPVMDCTPHSTGSLPSSTPIYDIARFLASQLTTDWERLRAFVLAADCADGGDAAAREHLGADLAGLMAALLERLRERGAF